MALLIEAVPPATSQASIEPGHRDLRLDACRGLALWFIFLDHVPDNLLAWLTLRNYGFSDTTEIFFFVSGITCMVAYGGALPTQGWRAVIIRALRRGLEIYVAFLLLLLSYLALVQIAGGKPEDLDATNTAVFFSFPQAAVIRAMTLQYMPVNTDVLPSFVLLHLSFPAVLWLLLRRADIALAASIALYLGVQVFGWNLPAWPRGEWYFNPLAWQVLFVFGAWVAAGGGKRLLPLVTSKIATGLAVSYLAFSFAVALSWQWHPLEGLMPEALAKLIYPVDKSNLAPVRLLHFLSLALIGARLVRHDWRGLSSPLITALIRCGENSLAIYCLGVLLSFVGLVAMKRISDGLAMQVAVSVAGVAVMIAAATAMTWMAKRDCRGPKLF
jgi:hypothetical protein